MAGTAEIRRWTWNRRRDSITAATIRGFRCLDIESAVVLCERTAVVDALPSSMCEGCDIATQMDQTPYVLIVPHSMPDIVQLWNNTEARVMSSVKVGQIVREIIASGQDVYILTEDALYGYHFDVIAGGAGNTIRWAVRMREEVRGRPPLLCVDGGTDVGGPVHTTVVTGPRPGYVTIRTHCEDGTLRAVEIAAHKDPVSVITLSADARVLATGSTRGTVIRTWNTATGEPIRELRRGSGPVRWYDLCLDSTGEWLTVLSDRNTLHGFALCESNTQSWLHGWGSAYFNSLWSRAQYSVEGVGWKGARLRRRPDGKWEIIIVVDNGSYYRVEWVRRDPPQLDEMVELGHRWVM
jgi:WD40 repeat protein